MKKKTFDDNDYDVNENFNSSDSSIVRKKYIFLRTRYNCTYVSVFIRRKVIQSD